MGRNVKVILQPVKFRKRNHIAVLSPNSPEVDEVIREFEDSEWSTGYRFWHMPLSPTTVREITRSLKGIATVDSSAFKNFKYEKQAEERIKRKRIKTGKPSEEQRIKLLEFREAYSDKGYSLGTVKVYMSMLNVFFGWYNGKKDFEITSADIDLFLSEYIDKNNLTTNYKRLMTNSLRRYFDFVGRDDLKKI